MNLPHCIFQTPFTLGKISQILKGIRIPCVSGLCIHGTRPLSVYEAQPCDTYYQSYFVFFYKVWLLITGNKFENHTKTIHSLQKDSTQEVLSSSNFLRYKVPTNVSRFESFSYIIYLSV